MSREVPPQAGPGGLRMQAAGQLLFVSFALLALLAASCSYATKGFTGDPAPGELPWLDFPADLETALEQPDGTSWLLPGSAIPLGGAVFVLDTGHDRLLKLGPAGEVLGVVNVASDSHLGFRRPLAMATDGERIAVANSDAAQLLLLDGSGGFLRAIPLPELGPRGLPARPTGVTFLPEGGFAVSDANNHLVMFLSEEGEVVATAGSGVRAEGDDGFNVPTALAADDEGFVYVVDTLNARIVKLSPEGEFVRQLSQRGSSVGSLSRPKGVAVDGDGRVFVSDGLLAAVQVFAEDGEYLGLIGRRESDIPGTESPFKAPAGLWLAEGRLYVADRFAGLLVFDLPSASG